MPAAKTTATPPAPTRTGGLERLFAIRARGSSVRAEVLAGLAILLAAAYLVVVVPAQVGDAGEPRGAATTAIIIAVVLGTLAMGLYANLPILVGPGLGGVALVTVTIVGQGHATWPVALGMVFWSGVAFLVLSLLGIRETVSKAIPAGVKKAISAGIGMFIALLGFREADLVTAVPKTNSLTVGDLSSASALLALAGLVVLTALMARKVPGAILIVVVTATLIGIPLGLTKAPAHAFAWPDSPGPLFFDIDIFGALRGQYFPYIFAFFTSEFFSMTGTLFAVARQAGLTDADGNVARPKRPFVVDSSAVIGGSLLGATSMTAYVESTAGSTSGGKTGLSAVVAAAGFAVLILLAPYAVVIPDAAVAPVLMYLGLRMLGALREVDFTDPTDGVPAALTVATTLFFGNFGTGIAVGLTSYVLVKLLAGRWRQIPVPLAVLMIPLGYYFVTLVQK